MKAMTLTRFACGHVDFVETDKPCPGPTGVLVKVLAWNARSLHLVDGETPESDDPDCSRS